MSTETASGLYVVEAGLADADEMARIITEAAIWRLEQKGLNRWPVDPEQNLFLAQAAIGRHAGYLGIAESQAVASMFLSGPDDNDRHIWGTDATDAALHVHKLSVGYANHGHDYGKHMVNHASSLAVEAGKTLLRMHYIYDPKYATLGSHYEDQGFELVDIRQQDEKTKVALLERPL